jgi:LPXTG-site transpeptidase (sortase) family protein
MAKLNKAIFVDKLKRPNINRAIKISIAILIMLVGAYLLLLRFAPQLPNVPVINSSNLELKPKSSPDIRNRIRIAKINLEMPFYTGDNIAVLDKGAWHRWPERGDPKIGGNFILSAHRFEMGLTPSQTRNKSPFYNIHKLSVGDSIEIFYEGRWYSYKIDKKYEVKPTALYIETASGYAKLTLYSCSLRGAADGRSVIEALPVQ